MNIVLIGGALGGIGLFLLGGAGLLAAFPMIYAVFLPALYLGVFLLLAGLIFRGVAFEFRFKSGSKRYWWDRAFFGGSTVASFAQGAVVGRCVRPGMDEADIPTYCGILQGDWGFSTVGVS